MDMDRPVELYSPDRPAGDFLAARGSRLKRRSYGPFKGCALPSGTAFAFPASSQNLPALKLVSCNVPL
jgi:hypothetical protein